MGGCLQFLEKYERLQEMYMGVIFGSTVGLCCEADVQ
jgi:hypothetical protein